MFTIDLVYFDDFDLEWKQGLAVTNFSILLFVNEGELTYWVDDEEIQLEKGDVLYIPKGSIRSGKTNEQCLHQKYSIHFSIEKDPFIPMLKDEKPHLVKTRRFSYLKQRFSSLHQKWLGKSLYFHMICKGILMEILGLVNEEMDIQHIPLKKINLVNDLKAFIIDHYREPIKIKDLADYTDRTPNYISSVFHELTGSTPIEFLHQVRIFNACDLLLNTPMTIAEIADYLGFCDSSYFNRVFKKVMGYPPSQHLNQPIITDLEFKNKH